MSINNLVAARESGEFDLHETMYIGSTLFCRVCLNENQRTLKCQKMKNIVTFIW